MSDPLYPPCPVCGAVSDQFRIPVWDNPEQYSDTEPDYIGCTECGTMHEHGGPNE